MLVERSGSFVTLTIAGVVHAAAALHALRRVRQALAAEPANGVLVAAHAAVFTLSQSDYFEFVAEALREPIRLPIAFVVNPAINEVASAHEAVMQRRGLRRRFFQEVDPAWEWLERECRETQDTPR
jgi:hypothetical protein